MGIILDGNELETAWWGPAPAAAPTIVLLHEGLGCVSLWRDFPTQVAAAAGCGVFAYSRFGYGRSAGIHLPRPLNYLHDEARLLPRVMDAAGCGRRSCSAIPMAPRSRRSMLAWARTPG
jgi:pimeloyl-ACP methyl ester carboxylesterase